MTSELDKKATPFGIYSKKDRSCLEKRLMNLRVCQKNLENTIKEPLDQKTACMINKKMSSVELRQAAAAAGGSERKRL